MISVKIFLAVFFVFSLLPSSVFAHILETGGSIGAVLHINPEDDPIAKEQSGFFFEFKDRQGKFKPEFCDCTFSILQGSKEIYSQPLFENNESPSLMNASLFFTFPEKDVYKIRVVGKPNRPDAFQPLTLEYDVRVAREANISTNNQNASNNSEKNWVSAHTIHLIGAGIILLFVIIAMIKQKISKTKV